VRQRDGRTDQVPDDAAATVARCEALIGEIALPDPFDMRVLCDRLGSVWGSTVCLYPTRTAPSGPCGMWVSLQIGGRLYDVFAYERDATPWHQAQMIFHEIGHRMLGHAGETELPLDTRELVEHLMPTLDPGLIKRTLGCAREPSAYDDPREKEAEYIGARLLDRAYGWRAGPLAPDAPADLLRLHSALRASGIGKLDG
jgi:hypothetical protein